MDRHEATFAREKETKNTVRYEEEPGEGKPPIIGTLYIQKWVLGETPPEKVKITLESTG